MSFIFDVQEGLLHYIPHVLEAWRWIKLVALLNTQMCIRAQRDKDVRSHSSGASDTGFLSGKMSKATQRFSWCLQLNIKVKTLQRWFPAEPAVGGPTAAQQPTEWQLVPCGDYFVAREGVDLRNEDNRFLYLAFVEKDCGFAQTAGWTIRKYISLQHSNPGLKTKILINDSRPLLFDIIFFLSSLRNKDANSSASNVSSKLRKNGIHHEALKRI